MQVRGEQLADGPILPLILRSVLLFAGAVVITGLIGPEDALGPVTAVLIVIALAAIPLPSTTARVLQAFAEVTVLAFVIGSTPEIGVFFVPMLLLAVFSTGQRGGLFLGVLGGLTASLSWTLAILSSSDASQVGDRITTPLVWLSMLVATGVIGGWIRRLRIENQSYGNGAYEDAFRLLTELQDVARNLSLGLDPTTLATSLLDEVRDLVPGSDLSVSVRSSGGRLAPLVASMNGTRSPEPTSDRTTGGRQHHTYPVRIGSRDVAVLDLHASELSSTAHEAVQRAVTEVAPKLAAALVFDDVRQLATVDERLRLAREIHDGVAQDFASVAYMLDDLASRVPADAAAELENLRTHVRRVVSELRLSIFDLRAGADDTVGLGTALSEHVQRIGQQSDLVVHTVLDEHGDRLPAGTEVELLRIAQEAVTNIRKHAQAGNMWVECTVDAPKAWVRIADDGVGLQPVGPQSMGLRGMHERARRIGADLTIGPRPGGGTVVEISIGNWDEERVNT